VRFVVYGAGAVGGVLGAQLFRAGHEVVLIARGAHYEAIRDQGMRFETPTGAETLPIPIVADPGEAMLQSDDVVVCAMKSQDTLAAVNRLSETAPSNITIVCAQNGVSNEQMALRSFRRVYGMCVVILATFVEPGVVEAFGTPNIAIIDVGRFPHGSDDTAAAIASAFDRAQCASVLVPDIMRSKYGKLVTNLGNAVEACCGRDRAAPIVERARAEGVAVLSAAGIDHTTSAEEAARRANLMRFGTIEGRQYGVSTLQSLARRTGAVEVDYLNGEIVLLGRLHGIATPINEALQRIVNKLARGRLPPGSMSADELEAAVEHEIRRADWSRTTVRTGVAAATHQERDLL
jgi:2-dehydropantoate 2-reductase